MNTKFSCGNLQKLFLYITQIHILSFICYTACLTLSLSSQNSLSIATSSSQTLKIPLQISDETNINDGSGKKPLARTQKQLLTLHNALIREAKMQGLAKYQASLPS
jgi:hypothetical protein